MYSRINTSQIFVLDQDEALAFYVDTLGLEVHTDTDLGFMRQAEAFAEALKPLLAPKK